MLTIVVEHGSASRAAALLFRAQSAVTGSARELEKTLGERLLGRRPSGMAAQLCWTCRRQTQPAHFRGIACPRVMVRDAPGARTSLHSWLNSLLLAEHAHLQLFVALVRHQHMPSAAQALGASQPAVSSTVRILENGADIALFHRTAREAYNSPVRAKFMHCTCGAPSTRCAIYRTISLPCAAVSAVMLRSTR
ncbi:LysR family transcriptional regulator [Paraburkholderia sp. BL27I4N3]|uniref:helix-turn-helix domain-containing protein n=1 Tax=Paraburkholderia sp. BL27I4N3 TaxID=1938805 RepID=UPI0028693D6A|nr:LysR family transcriptional regulator [Paraburkholderia sp. BL27I4N3]